MLCLNARIRYGVLGAMLLGGCATQRPLPPSSPPPPTANGDTTWQRAEPPGTQHYQVPKMASASGAKPLTRITPDYPTALLATCPPPAQIQALLIVDKTGRVGEVRVDGEPQADEAHRLFIAAVRAAALRWTFEPLKFDQWASNAQGETHVVSSQTRPFSESYLFNFMCRAGHAEVSSGKATAQR